MSGKASSSDAALAAATVADAMHRGVITCAPEESLRALAGLMARHRVHCVVVAGRDGTPWGVVSDLDLVRAALAGDLDELTAGDGSAGPLLRVAAGESLERAAQLMTESEVTHLVVVEDGEAPVGVLSTLDLAGALTR